VVEKFSTMQIFITQMHPQQILYICLHGRFDGGEEGYLRKRWLDTVVAAALNGA